MRTTAYVKAIMEVYGKTITGLCPPMFQFTNTDCIDVLFGSVLHRYMYLYKGKGNNIVFS